MAFSHNFHVCFGEANESSFWVGLKGFVYIVYHQSADSPNIWSEPRFLTGSRSKEPICWKESNLSSLFSWDYSLTNDKPRFFLTRVNKPITGRNRPEVAMTFLDSQNMLTPGSPTWQGRAQSALSSSLTNKSYRSSSKHGLQV